MITEKRAVRVFRTLRVVRAMLLLRALLVYKALLVFRVLRVFRTLPSFRCLQIRHSNTFLIMFLVSSESKQRMPSNSFCQFIEIILSDFANFVIQFPFLLLRFTKFKIMKPNHYKLKLIQILIKKCEIYYCADNELSFKLRTNCGNIVKPID